MSNHRNLLERVIRRQVRFQKALQERVKDDKAKEKQVDDLAQKNRKKKRASNTTK